MSKAFPNKGTFVSGNGGSDRQPSTTKITTGEDLRSKPCQKAGASKQNG